MYIIELNTIKKINLIFIIRKAFFSTNNKFLVSLSCFISITLSSVRANDSKIRWNINKKKLKMNILFVVFDKINYISLHLHKFDALYYH